MWTILARQDDTQDEHLWFGMGFTRMSQSAALEWIEILRGSNIDRAPLYVIKNAARNAAKRTAAIRVRAHVRLRLLVRA